MSGARGVLSHGSNGHLSLRKQIKVMPGCWLGFLLKTPKTFSCFVAQDSRIVFLGLVWLGGFCFGIFFFWLVVLLFFFLL